VCMGLDILLRERSNGEHGVVWLVNALRARYGPEKPFKDEDLFTEIGTIAGADAEAFLRDHLEKPGTLPLSEWLGKVAIELEAEGRPRPASQPGDRQLRLRSWWLGR
jgi:predicted metalloprotease with PDZ domain